MGTAQNLLQGGECCREIAGERRERAILNVSPGQRGNIDDSVHEGR